MNDLAFPMQPTPLATSQQCPLRVLMAFDFERLDEMLDEFIAAMEVDERKHALSLWRAFALRLNRRLCLEEQLLLPAYAGARPVEAQLLRHDDEQLRTRLARLGARLELSLLRAEHLRELVRLLRQHSHRKDALYAWAEVHLCAQARQELLQTFRSPLEGELHSDTAQDSQRLQPAT